MAPRTIALGPAFACAPLALTLLLAGASCGGGGGGPVDSGSTDASENDATVPPEGGLDAARDSGDAGTPGDSSSDAGSADAAESDAGDASPVAVTGCGAGAGTVTMTRGNVVVAYDLSSGVATFSYAALPKIVGFYAGVQLTTYVTSKQYATRSCTTAGDRVLITSTGNGLPPMQQAFTLDAGDHFLTQVTVTGQGLRSNWMAPVVADTAGGVDVGQYGDPRLLWVPFDNDMFVSYNAAPLSNATGTSFEVLAMYDNTSRNGIVVGSVTHDTWKTGVYYSAGTTKLDAMNVFGGANDATWTHDVVPHGAVVGDSISSPVVFVGFGADWRDELESFADANAAQVPRAPWDGGVPFGWNSWGVIQTAITHDNAVAVSDFLHTTLQPAGFGNDGTVYVNLDSYWDNLSTSELADFTAHCHANGQKAGVYWGPFADWGKNATAVVEGSSATYQQIWLRDGSGNPISVDGAYAVDPTHPATQSRIEHFLGEFMAAGFDYVKLDFLTHGALESTARYDPSITTGIAAYNVGMKYIASRIGGSMFVSESIAPLFPYQYGHSRRISCDTFGAATGGSSAEYELNSAAYGFWMSGRLYAFNDPDQMVFQGYPAADNRARLLSGVITGTVFLDGDDLTSDAGQTAAMGNLTNARVLAVARLGRAFRPVEGNTGAGTPDVFVLSSGPSTYMALFDFDATDEMKSVDLARAGLAAGTSYTVTDLFTGATSTASGTLDVAVHSHSGTLLEIHP